MKRIDLDIWKPNPENPRTLQYAGQRTAQEVFEELQHRLKSTGMLPDEYFLMDSHWNDGKEIPKDAYIFCATDYGGSEGIYVDVYLKWDEGEKLITQNFATGKTLGETEYDLDRMFLTASAITKAFHSDGLHARYAVVGGKPVPEKAVLHLTNQEQRILTDALVESRQNLTFQTMEAEQLLRRMTGSVTEFVNAVGARPMSMGSYDMAVLAVQDGDASAFWDAIHDTPKDKLGKLLIEAAGRPGDVGRNMTSSLLTHTPEKIISYEEYLAASKNAVSTGDAVRVLLMSHRAEECVADLDMGIYGEMISEAVYKHMPHIAERLIEASSDEQIQAAHPDVMAKILQSNNTQLAFALASKGIDATVSGSEVIHALAYHRNGWALKRLIDNGMVLDTDNLSMLAACIKCEQVEMGKNLIDHGMDFDQYAEWSKTNPHAAPKNNTFEILRIYWEDEIKPGLDGQDESTGIVMQ